MSVPVSPIYLLKPEAAVEESGDSPTDTHSNEFEKETVEGVILSIQIEVLPSKSHIC